MKYIEIFLITAILVSGCMYGGGDSDDSASSSTTTLKATTTTAKSTTTTTAKAVTTITEKSGIVDKMSDMTAAIASGESYKCTYKYQGVLVESFVKGEKYKSKTLFEGMEINSLSDGEWAYTWTSGEKEGMKFKIEDIQELNDGDHETASYQDMADIASIAKEIDCRPDVIPENAFNPPSTIVFQDFGEQMKQMQQMAEELMQDAASNPCAMCDFITDASAKSDCLQSCGA